MNGIEQLCPNCGLCCDSTLFADVELRRGDDPRRLAALGLVVQQKTERKLAAPQPCACFDGKFCKIYAERPQRCRCFECGLLKQVTAGQMAAGAALKKITEAKRLAEKVREMLRASGPGDERLSLADRYAEAMRAPVDCSVEGAADRRGELMLAVNDLMQRLERDFLR
ncbi:MAG TPA: YkgJ family cysteine cluster protein [Candidatus Acidoferrales bacterium]|nr:YkgJ family cysteine cluster protein [Candidatus Acidoferrales bacterium]